MKRSTRVPYWRRPRLSARDYYDVRRRNRAMPSDAIRLGEDPHTGAVRFLTREDITTHLRLVGPTGGGKSKQLQAIFRQLLDGGGVVIDPHGDLFDECKRDAYALGMTDRVIVLDFGVADYILALKALAGGCNHSVEAARDVELINRAVGEGDHAARPRQNRWLFNAGYALRSAGAPFAAIQEVLSPTPTDVGVALCDLVDQTEVRADLDWLNSGTAIRWREERTESSMNRLRSVLANDRVRLSLAQRHGLDPAWAMDERKLLLVNLRAGEQLSTEARRLVGNLLVSAFCREAMGRPKHRRVPFFLMVDEAHLFVSDEVAEILTGGRKFLLNLLLSYQFDDEWKRHGDECTLEAIRSCCRTTICFGDQPPHQLLPIAEKHAVASFDPLAVKDEIVTTRQLHDGFDRDMLHAWGESTSRSESAGDVAGESTAVPYAEGILGNEDEDYGVRSSSTTSTAMSASSGGESHGEHEVLVPRYRTVNEVSGRTFWSFDEHLNHVLQQLVRMPDRHAAVFKKGGRAEFYRVDDVEPAVIDDAAVAEHDERVFTNPVNPYVTDEAAARAYETWKSSLLPAPASMPNGPLPTGTGAPNLRQRGRTRKEVK